LLHLWSRGGRLFNEQGRPCFHDAIGEEALSCIVDLIVKDRVCPPQTLTYDSVASGVAYAAGQGAMMWNWCGFAAVAELPPSKIIGHNRLALVPRGETGRHTSLNIYWVLGIPTGSVQKDLAYAFLRHCASPAMDRVTARCGGTGVRLSTWRDPVLQAQFNHYRLMEAAHQNIDSPPRLPEYPAINMILSQMQWQAVTGEKTVREALDEAAHAVTTLLRETGRLA